MVNQATPAPIQQPQTGGADQRFAAPAEDFSCSMSTNQCRFIAAFQQWTSSIDTERGLDRKQQKPQVCNHSSKLARPETWKKLMNLSLLERKRLEKDHGYDAWT